MKELVKRQRHRTNNNQEPLVSIKTNKNPDIGTDNIILPAKIKNEIRDQLRKREGKYYELYAGIMGEKKRYLPVS